MPTQTNPADYRTPYALQVVDPNLGDDLPKGSFALIDPAAECQSGDRVVIWRRGSTVGDMYRLTTVPGVPLPYTPHPESEVAHIVEIARLRDGRRGWLPCADILAIHRVMGPVPDDVRLYEDRPNKRKGRTVRRAKVSA